MAPKAYREPPVPSPALSSSPTPGTPASLGSPDNAGPTHPRALPLALCRPGPALSLTGRTLPISRALDRPSPPQRGLPHGLIHHSPRHCRDPRPPCLLLSPPQPPNFPSAYPQSVCLQDGAPARPGAESVAHEADTRARAAPAKEAP